MNRNLHTHSWHIVSSKETIKLDHRTPKNLYADVKHLILNCLI